MGVGIAEGVGKNLKTWLENYLYETSNKQGKTMATGTEKGKKTKEKIFVIVLFLLFLVLFSL